MFESANAGSSINKQEDSRPIHDFIPAASHTTIPQGLAQFTLSLAIITFKGLSLLSRSSPTFIISKPSLWS